MHWTGYLHTWWAGVNASSWKMSFVLPFGVPQGSAWTTAFTLYTTPLSTVSQGHSILHHLYADDSHLCISFTSDDSANQLDSLKSCLDSVLNWMLHNRLKLHPSKTDFLLIGHEQQQKKHLSRFPITLMGIDANPSASARNLGVDFDQNFNFRKHTVYLGFAAPVFTTFMTCTAFIKVWILIMQKSLACALVTSRLDYCNLVLQGVAGKDLERLQWVQNTLAFVVTRSRPFAHAAPLLLSLHWFPVKFRIKFKLAFLTIKILKTGQLSFSPFQSF